MGIWDSMEYGEIVTYINNRVKGELFTDDFLGMMRWLVSGRSGESIGEMNSMRMKFGSRCVTPGIASDSMEELRESVYFLMVDFIITDGEGRVKWGLSFSRSYQFEELFRDDFLIDESRYIHGMFPKELWDGYRSLSISEKLDIMSDTEFTIKDKAEAYRDKGVGEEISIKGSITDLMQSMMKRNNYEKGKERREESQEEMEAKAVKIIEKFLKDMEKDSTRAVTKIKREKKGFWYFFSRMFKFWK